jgi:Starch-binding associating with outer membrane
MFYKSPKLLFAILLGSLGMFSCTKNLDTNSENPNGIGINAITGKDVFAQALVTTVTNNSGFSIVTATDNYDYAQNWMGYWARNTSWAASGLQAQIENFQLPTSSSDGLWSSSYHNIYDYNYVIANSSEGSILPGASRVVRTMIFQDLVDQFGNIPYSQAADPAITTPAYVQASQATADGASDVMFNGNKNLWIQLANTIKLRIILRQVPNVYSPTDPFVTSELSGAIAQGGFLGPGQDAVVNPGFQDITSQTQNPFWADYGFQPGGSPGPPQVGTFYQNYNFFCANVTFLDFLDSISDPRLGYFYGLNGVGGYGGNILGVSSNLVANTSPIGTGLLQSASMGAWLLTASQSLFMQAEAAQRGMISGNYSDLYKQAVEESFRYLQVPDFLSAADQYLTGSANGMVNIGTSANPLQTIIYQKWVSECGFNPLEAYSDYRRTGYPYFSFISGSVSPGTPMPVRLLYPQSEYTQNLASLQANLGMTVQPASAIYDKIFWQP